MLSQDDLKKEILKVLKAKQEMWALQVAKHVYKKKKKEVKSFKAFYVRVAYNLRRLERDKLVTSTVHETGSFIPKRVYKLMKNGRKI